ncbi:NAD(P)H azoreductase-like [Sycon ciliatum]|uniref:NAD(P)H azoreductase-like n=1 Tax=Sycon ciliatum TaxID=27933 RepID=UPI0031F6CD7C
MAKPVVFVIGATGSIGVSTLTALSQRYGKEVKILAGVRNPDKADKLRALDNVTIVKAEIGDPNLNETLAGVDSLYIVVPGAEDRTELTRTTAEAARAAGVKFILSVSVTSADRPELTFGKQFSGLESHIKSLGVQYAFLRLPLFYENNLAHQASIAGQGAFYGPVEADKPFTPVSASDAGVAAAVILRHPAKHHGKTYTLASDRHTKLDIAAAFSSSLGKEVKYVQVAYDQAKQAFMTNGVPEWQTDGIMELYHLIDAGDPVLNLGDLSDFEKITGEKPTSIAQWVAGAADIFKST